MSDDNNNQLFIPSKIKVGYQVREDTYTKKLGFVIYYDNKGKLRQENAWKGWIKHDMGDFDNAPTEGFVLNKDVGGTRSSYSWNTRREKVRVFDPRGFEFEIPLETLLFILQESTSTKGKGLEGEFVYAWSGKNIGIIPVNSQAYQSSIKYTKAQSAKVSTKELIPGCIYETKQMKELIYLGKFNYVDALHDWSRTFNVTKGHIFANVQPKKEERDYGYKRFHCLTSLSPMAYRLSETPVDNYAELMDEFNKSEHSVDRKRFDIINASPDNRPHSEKCRYNFYREIEPDKYEAVVVTQHSDRNPNARYYYNSYNRDNDPPQMLIKGYTISPFGLLSLADGKIEFKEKKSKTDSKFYSQEEFDALNIKQITVNHKKTPIRLEVK